MVSPDDPRLEDGPRLGRRGDGLGTSPTMAAAAAASTHPSPIDLSVGESSAEPPEPARAAAAAAALEVRTRYGPVGGLPALREAVAADVSARDGIPWTSDNVVITAGGKPALADALSCLLDPGDRVVLFAPYWPTFRAQVAWPGGEVHLVQPGPDGLPTVDAIESAIDSDTRAVLVNHPANPTGTCWDRRRTSALADTCERHDAWLVLDQVYGTLVLDGDGPPLLALAPRLARRSVCVESFSKRFAMTGYRLGAAIGPRRLIDAMIALASNATTHPSMLSQHAGIAALARGADWEREHVRSLRRKRDRIVAALDGLSGLRCLPPAAGLYVFIDARGWIDALGLPGDRELVAHLRDEIGVRLVPGSVFGATGFVRLSFAVDDALLDEAARRLRAFETSLTAG